MLNKYHDSLLQVHFTAPLFTWDRPPLADANSCCPAGVERIFNKSSAVMVFVGASIVSVAVAINYDSIVILSFTGFTELTDENNEAISSFIGI